MPGHDADAPTGVFVLEQTLGHITHGSNLRTLVPRLAGIEPVFVPVQFETSRRVPGWSNWTIRAGVRASRSLRRLARAGVRADVIFVHTQVPAVLLGRRMRRTPTIVSLDATPEQYDLLGEFYSHEPGPAPLERLKRAIHRRCFERAAHLVTWSEWARHGLVSAYGVAPERVTAIAPGVDVDRWRPPHDARSNRQGPVRILFVGNDLRRKGGDLLIDAARRLRQDARIPEFAIHLVTSAEVDPEPGVIVHRGLSANSPELITQYRDADIFCLPTRGDCLPMVLAEAAATGLPLISTDVGAIHEVVVPGRTGELIQSGSLDALIAALRALIEDPQLRLRYGAAARRLAEQRHDARANAARVVDVMLACLPALQTSSRRRPPTE